MSVVARRIGARTHPWFDSPWHLVVGVGVLYVIGVRSAFWIIEQSGLGAVYFPPAGITLAVLVLAPVRRWPVVLAVVGVCELGVDVWMGVPLEDAIGFAAANVVGPAVGATLIGQVLALMERPGRSALLWTIIGCGAGIGTFVSALIGSTVAFPVGSSDQLTLLGQWWLGDALGVVAIGLLILSIALSSKPRLGITTPGLVVVGLLSIGVVMSLAFTDLPVLSVPLAGTLIVAAMFGSVPANLSTAIASTTVAVWLAFEDGELITGLTTAQSLVVYKLTLIVFGTMAAFVAVESSQRVRATTAAVEHRMRADNERETVEALQRLLLPPAELRGESFTASGLYVAATRDLGVGGDWYEVLELPDGRVMVAVGDIVGHGAAAAHTMNRLRILTTLCAADSHTAGDLLQAVEARARGLVDAFASTVWIGLFDPSTAELSYTAAGHPPGFLASDDGVVRLESGLNPPMFVDPGQPKTDRTVTVPAGATLVLYTDGLIERPGEAIDVGLSRLEAAVAQSADSMSPEELWERVSARDPGRNGRDDSIVLMVSFDAASALTSSERIESTPAVEIESPPHDPRADDRLKTN
ncbi:MAG: SpoIIE family protein phosphatase [Actinomycetota bacterium]